MRVFRLVFIPICYLARLPQCSTLRFWAGCPDIIQMAEIQLDWHMLSFFFPMKNLFGKILGLVFFCADKLRFTHCFAEAEKQETAAQRLSLMPLPTENNSHMG